MRLKIDIVPDETIEAHNLKDKVDEDGWVHLETRKGMCGLKQAG